MNHEAMVATIQDHYPGVHIYIEQIMAAE